MKLARPSDIAKIDAYAEEHLGIPKEELMRRAGHAVAAAVRALLPHGASVCILAGEGNNGGDGYAAACELSAELSVTVVDIFGTGQRSEEGRRFAAAYSTAGGRILPFSKEALPQADLFVDAVFGTGFHGELPERTRALARLLNAQTAKKLAVDVPLGVYASDGRVAEDAVRADATVVLSFMKVGLLSYPAAAYVGRVFYDSLGLSAEAVSAVFSPTAEAVDEAFALSHLPRRERNTSKGSFGSLLMITGSEVYRGAAALSLGAALRGGCGYVTYLGTQSLVDLLTPHYPEAIYQRIPPLPALTEAEIAELATLSAKNRVTLVGCGCADSEGLLCLVKALLAVRGGTLVLDADALNALAHAPQEAETLLREARRTVILTPHPGELARLVGRTVSEVQAARMTVASDYARRTGTLLLLKGAGTLLAVGDRIYINTTGSPALSKAGSGDVLAGALASLVASGDDPEALTALAAYYHGKAGDTLEEEFSSFGVTPSDLSKQIAREIAKTEQNRK